MTMTTAATVEDQIIAAIHDVPSNELKGDRTWTKAVFKSIADLGVALGYKICTSSSDGEHDGGWLYDLIWYQTDANGLLTSMPLALESEWHKKYERIKYDFEKLLVCRAKYKIMVFQATGETIQDYITKMEAGIKAFEGSATGETYLLACFDETRWIFEIRTIRT